MIRRGEIYWVKWPPGRGAEQMGSRPGLVIQNEAGNRYSRTTIVAAVSTKPYTGYPFHIRISVQDSGLHEDSIVKCEQIQTVDQARLGRLLGQLSPEKMQEVDVALHRSLGLEH